MLDAAAARHVELLGVAHPVQLGHLAVRDLQRADVDALALVPVVAVPDVRLVVDTHLGVAVRVRNGGHHTGDVAVGAAHRVEPVLVEALGEIEALGLLGLDREGDRLPAVLLELLEGLLAPLVLAHPDGVVDVRLEAGDVRHHLVHGQVHGLATVSQVVRHVAGRVRHALPVGALRQQLHLLLGDPLVEARRLGVVLPRARVRRDLRHGRAQNARRHQIVLLRQPEPRPRLGAQGLPQTPQFGLLLRVRVLAERGQLLRSRDLFLVEGRVLGVAGVLRAVAVALLQRACRLRVDLGGVLDDSGERVRVPPDAVLGALARALRGPHRLDDADRAALPVGDEEPGVRRVVGRVALVRRVGEGLRLPLVPLQLGMRVGEDVGDALGLHVEVRELLGRLAHELPGHTGVDALPAGFAGL
ncbi:hypothetical protein [Streptomyces sp. NPDC000410]|uniref:hypothetical protein n=1 Tax=Streptomyces sp. NPDC000410 TaxID=3154254 RepID=UPI00332E14D4